MNRVHERLEQEAARRGTTDRLARLRPFLDGPEPEGTYAAIAREWGVGKPAVRVALHRLRQRFAAILRAEIGRTVESLDGDRRRDPLPPGPARRLRRRAAVRPDALPGALLPSLGGRRRPSSLPSASSFASTPTQPSGGASPRASKRKRDGVAAARRPYRARSWAKVRVRGSIARVMPT